MLVDEDDLMQYVIQIILNKLEVTGRVKSATSGDEALKYLQEYGKEGNFPKLVITNIHMKGLNGIELIKAIKAMAGFRKEKTEIFVLSPQLKDSEIKELESLEVVNKILVKPELPAGYNQLRG